LLDAARTTTPTRAREILLVLKILAAGQKNVETFVRGTLQELAVLKAGPAFLLDCPNVVPDQLARQAARDLFIEENAHWLLRPHAQPQAL
jgi:hypothetical protein